MEQIIKREVTLNPSRSYWPGLLPFVGQDNDFPREDGDGNLIIGNGNYGNLILDIDLSKIPTESEFHTLSNLFPEDGHIVHYADLMSYYRWFTRFFSECQYFINIVKPENSRFSPVKTARQVDDLTSTERVKNARETAFWQWDCVDIQEVFFVSEMPDTEEYGDGNIIGLTRTPEAYEKYLSIGGILFYNFIERAIGKVYISDTISGKMLPEYIYIPDIVNLRQKLLKYKDGTCCDRRTYNNLGGDAMLAFLSTYTNDYIKGEFNFFRRLASTGITSIFLDVFIPQTYDNIGLLSLVAEEWVPGKTYEKGDYVIYNEQTYCCIADGGSCSILFNSNDWETNTPGTSEDTEVHLSICSGTSQLAVFKNGDKTPMSDDNEELPGVPIVSAGQCSFTDPYISGKPINVYKIDGPDGEETYGDMIYSITSDSIQHTITYKYVIAGKLIQNGDSYTYTDAGRSGIMYEDTYPYEEETITFTYEGNTYEDVPYQKLILDYEDGTPILSKITYRTNDEELNPDEYISSPVFMKEELFGISEPIKYNISIDIDRGNSAAFERHLKLMEVNTFQDLMEYQNNYFNISED